jgi:hypothetical protein
MISRRSSCCCADITGGAIQALDPDTDAVAAMDGRSGWIRFLLLRCTSGLPSAPCAHSSSALRVTCAALRDASNPGAVFPPRGTALVCALAATTRPILLPSAGIRVSGGEVLVGNASGRVWYGARSAMWILPFSLDSVVTVLAGKASERVGINTLSLRIVLPGCGGGCN